MGLDDAAFISFSRPRRLLDRYNRVRDCGPSTLDLGRSGRFNSRCWATGYRLRRRRCDWRTDRGAAADTAPAQAEYPPDHGDLYLRSRLVHVRAELRPADGRTDRHL